MFEITISVMITLIGLVKVFNACPLNSGILVELLDEFCISEQFSFNRGDNELPLSVVKENYFHAHLNQILNFL